jgi:hypothetical protein
MKIYKMMELFVDLKTQIKYIINREEREKSFHIKKEREVMYYPHTSKQNYNAG